MGCVRSASAIRAMRPSYSYYPPYPLRGVYYYLWRSHREGLCVFTQTALRPSPSVTLMILACITMVTRHSVHYDCYITDDTIGALVPYPGNVGRLSLMSCTIKKSSFLRFESNQAYPKRHNDNCCQVLTIAHQYNFRGYVFGYEKYQNLLIFCDVK